MHAKVAVNSAKAVRELGATFRTFEETVRDEVAWFRAHGYIT
jgi:dihydroflavonol-4-reductase